MNNSVISRLSQWLFFLLLIFVPACSTQPNQQTVSFMVFGDPAEYNAYKELVDAFNSQHPDIHVVLTHVPSPREYRTRLV
ncbi:MAG: hypothetical protein KDE48_19935, partial [Anaerolineales bacterium]|nr:hypothetical protein [Anaerolineales bacterium]